MKQDFDLIRKPLMLFEDKPSFKHIEVPTSVRHLFSTSILILTCLVLVNPVIGGEEENANIHRVVEPSVYHNPEGHFSITMPAGWEEIPKDAIETVLKSLKENYGYTSPPQYGGGFHKLDTTYFLDPIFYLELTEVDGGLRVKLRNFFPLMDGKTPSKKPKANFRSNYRVLFRSQNQGNQHLISQEK
jgi:hypothetical protein